MKKYCVKHGKEFKETEFNSLVTDIINDEVKDKGGDIIKKSCDCDISTDVKTDLANLLTKDDEIYKSLRKEIFGIE